MQSVMGTLLCAAWLMNQAPAPCQSGSYLHRLALCPDGVYRPKVEQYYPQPGDLIFFDDHSKKWDVLYRMVGSGPPFHSGIACRLPDGSMAWAEAGPDDIPRCYILDAIPRLHCFKGTIWIRRLRRPLCKEASDRLTQFAVAQEGKRYAVGRLLLQATAIRCRTGLRYRFFARTYLNRNAWLCSEFVVAAGTVAGLFDPKIHPANAIYPRDIIFDNKYPMLHNWEKAALWRPTPEPVNCSLIPR